MFEQTTHPLELQLETRISNLIKNLL